MSKALIGKAMTRCSVCLFLFFFALPSFTLFAAGPVMGPLIADRPPSLYDRNRRDRNREERRQERNRSQSQSQTSSAEEESNQYVLYNRLYPPY